MRLPPSLVRLRSAIAQCLGLILRAVEPFLLRLRRFCYEARARAQLRGTVAPGVQFIGPIAVEGEGLVHIGAGTRVGRRVFFETYHGAEIRIGERVTINDGVTIVAHAGVTIGSHTMIGEYASVRDANHGTVRGRLVRDQPHDARPVAIGEDAWIGRGVLVAKGVQFGAGAVAGANSVVTRDVSPGQIVAGAPARPIGERREPGAER